MSNSITGEAEATAPKQERVCYWPVCAPITSFGQFNWPDIFHLAYLDEVQVEKYEKNYFFVVYRLEPIIQRFARERRNEGKDGAWGYICAAWKQANPWSNITTARSLESMYSRSRKNMRESVEVHNELARGETLEQRADRTLLFLTMGRKTGIAPKTEHRQDDIVYLPLIEVKVVITYPESSLAGNSSDENQAGVENAEFANEGYASVFGELEQHEEEAEEEEEEEDSEEESEEEEVA